MTDTATKVDNCFERLLLALEHCKTWSRGEIVAKMRATIEAERRTAAEAFEERHGAPR